MIDTPFAEMTDSEKEVFFALKKVLAESRVLQNFHQDILDVIKETPCPLLDDCGEIYADPD